MAWSDSDLVIYSGLAKKVGNNERTQAALQLGADRFASRLSYTIIASGYISNDNRDGHIIDNIKVGKSKHASGVMDRVVSISHPHIHAIEFGHFTKVRYTTVGPRGGIRKQSTRTYVEGLHFFRDAIRSMKR